MSTDPKILIVGFGNMGRALLRGWLDAKLERSSIAVADSSEAAVAEARRWGIETADAEPDARFDVVVLAVKPQQIDAAVASYGHRIAEDGMLVSIAAGRTIASLQHSLGAMRPIVRAMPNTPAAIARGTTVACASQSVTQAQRELCGRLLAAVGVVYWLEDEELLDAVTAVSGSGPAYVFLLTECLAAAGERLGLPASLSADLAMHTVAGAGAYAIESSTSLPDLRAQVTSPGGTTAAALAVFMRGAALQQLVDEAVAAAAARSRELSKG